MKQHQLIKIAAFSGAICVTLGAFAAHTLKESLSSEQLQTFETAVRYQFYHTFALLALASLQQKLSIKFATIAAYCFLTGIFIFCGSLYFLACSELLFGKYLNWLGAITPIGGLGFIAGWLFLLRAVQIKN